MNKKPKSINAYELNEWFNSANENPFIIDVREQSELKIASFQKKFLHLPISKASIDDVQRKIDHLKEKKIVVICHAGIRSHHFAQWLLDKDYVSEIWNLEEGIDGWSRYIDPTIPRY